jgi:hypothetical protein
MKFLDKLKKVQGGVKILTFLFIFAGMFAAFQGGKNSIEGGADTVIVAVTDTIELLDIQYTQLPAVTDTILVPIIRTNTIFETDTVMVYTEMATLDTLLNEGHLNVAYSPRFNWFNLLWQPHPVAVTYDSVIHTYKVDLTETKTFSILTGAGYSFGDRAYAGLGISIAGYSLLYEQSAEDLRVGIWKQVWGF